MAGYSPEDDVYFGTADLWSGGEAAAGHGDDLYDGGLSAGTNFLSLSTVHSVGCLSEADAFS